MKKVIAVMLIVAMGAFAASANAGLVQHVISINIAKADTSMDILPAETAGFLPLQNWNNVPGVNGAYGGTIVNEAGTVTTATWEQGGSDTHMADPDVTGLTTPDARLYGGGAPVSSAMSSGWGTTWWSDWSQFRMTNVLAALGGATSYEIHFYVSQPAGGLLTYMEQWVGNSGWGNQAPPTTEPVVAAGHWAAFSYDGNFTGENHYVMPDVAEDTLIITAREMGWPFPDFQWKSMQLEGIQIIGSPVFDAPPVTVPEPAGLGIVGLALLAVRRRRS